MYQILIGGVDFSAYYKSKSLSITDRSNSERVSFKFIIEDPPFIPTYEQAVYIYESAAHRRALPEAAGRVKRPAQRVIGYKGYAYEIEVGSWVRDIDRASLIGRSYTFATTGFIARDIATFLPAFDSSGITTLGAMVPYFENRNATPSQLFDTLASYNGWNWWVTTQKKIMFDYPSNNPAPFSVTDANWTTICNPKTFVCESDTQNLINQATMVYNGKYLDGTVNVSNGITSVTGNGTLFTSKIKPGATFQVYANSNISYTVARVVNDTQFLLSGVYNEISQSSIAYTITGIPLTMEQTEAASVQMMAAITGDTGIYPGRIDPPAANLTFIEAQLYMKGKLITAAYPVYNISFESSSRLISGQFFAGQSVLFSLTDFNLNTSPQITEVVKTCLGGTDNDGYPLYDYKIKFETKIYALESDLRLMQIATTNSLDTGASSLDDITGVYIENPVITELSAGFSTSLTAGTDTPIITETFVGTDTSPNGPPYYWGNPGTTVTNPDGSLKDSVTGFATGRWGFSEFA